MELPKYVANILKHLEAAGHEAWCVGGCVRDSLLGRVPGDWDVTTSALPQETLAIFKGRAFPTGLQHGTVTVRSGADTTVEVTTFRVDGEYQDHRHPASVTFTRSLDKDLARRDFTVNAMAVNLQGELRDPFGGQQDLKDGVLRCVGDPDRRFQEDALRMLRGMRFVSVLGFDEDYETDCAMDRNAALLKDIAPERIQIELTKLLCGKYAKEALDNHPFVIGAFWPEVLPMLRFDQKNIHHCYDVWEHSTVALANTPQIPELRVAAFLHDIGKPSVFSLDEDGVGHFYGHAKASVELSDTLLRRLRFPNAFRERVLRLVEWHDRDIPRTDRGVRRALGTLGEEELRLLLDLKRADNLAQASAFRGRQEEIQLAEDILNRLLEEDTCVSLKTLAVNGRDVMQTGLQGPPVGEMLDFLLEQVIDGTLPNHRKALLKAIRKLRKSGQF